MSKTNLSQDLSRCVRCGACKAMCPTYETTMNETMGARGRVALLGELSSKRFAPSARLAEKIYSCMLCGACKDICPVGINIPEAMYQGRSRLKKSYKKGRLLRRTIKHAVSRMDSAFSALRMLQKCGMMHNVPGITPEPFKNSFQVHKKLKNISRIAIFAGCSVNYFHPHLGRALSNVLLSGGYEIVVFKGELCCGAPLRSMGLHEEAASVAKKNIEHFSKVRAEAIISMCPTCTMVIRDQYPDIAGGTIPGIMDANEFLVRQNLIKDLHIGPRRITYHDPCHLSHGLGIREEPRRILRGIRGVEFVEMNNADECCGFAGFFSLHFKKMSENIGRKKLENIHATSADTVVTSCPGCIMHLDSLKAGSGSGVKIKHIVEIIDEAMHGRE